MNMPKKYVRKTADVVIDGRLRRCRIAERSTSTLFGEQLLTISYKGKTYVVAPVEKETNRVTNEPI